MTIAQRTCLIAAIALLSSASVLAADPPTADAPAESDLPSKPYPDNATPKAFQPRKDASPKADAVQNDKSANQPPTTKAPDKAAEKPAEKSTDKHDLGRSTDNPAPIVSQYVPKPQKAPKKYRAKPNPQVTPSVPAVNPAMQEIAREAAARQSKASATSYTVKARDNLDSVIRKTLPSQLFSDDVLRQAYVRANPALLSSAKLTIRPGQVLQVPNAAILRAVIMGEADNDQENKISLNATVPVSVVAPIVAPAAFQSNPPVALPRLPLSLPDSANSVLDVAPEEKKKWVRYP